VIKDEIDFLRPEEKFFKQAESTYLGSETTKPKRKISRNPPQDEIKISSEEIDEKGEVFSSRQGQNGKEV